MCHSFYKWTHTWNNQTLLNQMLLPLILPPFLLGMLILILSCFCWQWFQGVTFNPMQLLKDSKTVCGFDLKQIRHHPDLKKEAMEHLIQLYSEGKIKPVIDQVYAFEEVSFTLTRQICWLVNYSKVGSSLNAFRSLLLLRIRSAHLEILVFPMGGAY